MTEATEDQTVEVPQMAPEDYQRLHEFVNSIEVQFENIAKHHPALLGPALLAVSTYMVEKVYHCSNGVENANALLACAQEQGLQSWVDEMERQAAAAAEPEIVVPS